ncbi:MAG: ATP-binding protein [Gammaproteobacteria bacterium]
MRLPFQNMDTKVRITLGLMGLMLSLLFTASFLGLIPDARQAVHSGRVALAEAIAVNSSAFITHSDLRRMEANLAFLIERNDDLLSAAVRRANGTTVVLVGEHEQNWLPLDDGLSTASQIEVPVWAGDNQWGVIQLRFEPVNEPGWFSFTGDPLFQQSVFFVITGFVLFYLYLGKMLKQLDPSQAIPDRVRAALDTMAEGLLVLDRKQNIVLANQSFAAIIGKAPDDIIGYRASDFPWQYDRDRDSGPQLSPWASALQNGHSQLNEMVRLQRDDAGHRTFKVNCAPIVGDGKTINGVLVSFDDVTQLEEKEVELRKSKEEAEEANRAKSDFLANMSHEIRTPMNAILGFTEVLKRGYGQGERDTSRHLNTIHSSGKHLLELINDILDLSKVEAGRIEVERIQCAPYTIISELVNILGVKAQEKGISLSYEPDSELPEFIQTDPARFRQIITNLVGNAIKFTEQGSVRIVPRLEYEGESPRFLVDVIDSGIGMDEAQIARIFDPFTQADSSITRRFGGTGLGLSISQKFAKALGGDISVRSQSGEGSVFTVSVDTGSLQGVRMLGVEELLVLAQQTDAVQHTEWQFPPSRVLVVDDGAENRDLVQLVMEEVGLTVDTAENGEEGYQKALASDYQLILMDLSMPVMDGLTATGLLRDQGVDLPIIALSAHAMGDVEQKCIAAGFTGFISKPIEIDTLLSVAAEHLGGTQLDGSASAVVSAAPSAESSEASAAEPIVPQFASTNPRLRVIAERFILRLDDKLAQMDQCWQNRDFTELAALAHWLKGAGGTVGFNDFTQPAKELEDNAKQQDVAAIPAAIQVLHDMRARVSLDSDIESAATTAPQTPRQAVPDSTPLFSRLPTNNPRAASIVERFVQRLSDQLDVMNHARARHDFAQIAEIAHWLKGTGGSAGFDAFTEPAEHLAEAALGHNEASVDEAIAVLRGLADRIQLPQEKITAAVS